MNDYKHLLHIKMVDKENGDTIGEYLTALLSSLWMQGEGFSGKRPFGNSGWEHDLYAALAASGLAGGYSYDIEWEQWDLPEDKNQMDKMIFLAIEALYEKPYFDNAEFNVDEMMERYSATDDVYHNKSKDFAEEIIKYFKEEQPEIHIKQIFYPTCLNDRNIAIYMRCREFKDIDAIKAWFSGKAGILYLYQIRVTPGVIGDRIYLRYAFEEMGK